MTSKQQSDLDRAIERAEAEGCVIVGKGYRKSDGAVVYAVNSAKSANRWYLVAVLPGRLVCNCAAHGLCKHRGAVHKCLIAERSARDTAPLYRDNRPFSIWR